MTLRDIYDDAKTTTRNPSLLAKRAGVTVKSAQAFLRNQTANQVSQRAVKPPESSYAPTGGPYGEYLGDTIFLTDYAGVNAKRASILTIMGANNRYAYARAMTAPLTSAKTAAAMVEMLDENAASPGGTTSPILSLRTDGGPEFSGDFSALLKKRGISLSKGEPGTHEQLARLDRFHRSLRQMIGEVFAITDSHQWYKVLPDLIANYNDRPNRGLGVGVAPADVGLALEQKIISHDLARASRVRAETDNSGVGCWPRNKGSSAR
jgi:transposase InsO family protein